MLYRLYQWLGRRIAERSCATLDEFTRTGCGTLRVYAPNATSGDVRRFLRAVEQSAGPILADIGYTDSGCEILIRRAA